LVFKPQIVCIPLDWHEIAVMGGMSYHDSLFSNIADKTAIEFWPFGDKKSGFPSTARRTNKASPSATAS
jgi:hypothetical protein